MIRHLAVLAVAAIYLTASGTAAPAGKDLDKASETFYKFLLHYYEGKKLDDEISTLETDDDFETKMKTFNGSYKEIVEEFFGSYKKGMLPRGRLYSSFYPEQKEEMIKLFRVFYYAPDLLEFTSIANWALNRVNEYQFFSALDFAVTHRADTQYVGHRHPYRIFPELFFTSDVMKKVYDIKMGLSTTAEKVENNTFIVKGGYSDSYVTDTTNNEYKLTYFTEDIRHNEWYYTTHLKLATWMSGEEFKHQPVGKRGEFMYYTHRWIASRYQMERQSNDLNDLEYMDWKNPAVVGYSPQMNYPNGMQFPKREKWTNAPLHMTRYLKELEIYDSRVVAALDSGFVMTQNGTLKSIRSDEGLNTVGNVLLGDLDSSNKDFYGSIDRLGRYVLGSAPKPRHVHQVLPSALEHDLTSFRDPAFFIFCKKIDFYFTKYLEYLGPHPREEIAFEGVKINSVNITGKHIFTFFERVDTPIDTFWRGNEEQPSVIKVRQYRLNHKPFTYKLNITSDRDVKASIRFFLGPKYDVHGNTYNVTNSYKYFIEILVFTHNLKKGENIVKHKSIINDFGVPYDHNLEPLVILTGDDPVALNKKRHSYPLHLLFPKGKVEGMTFQFFVYVSEFAPDKKKPKLDTYSLYRDFKPLGFPLNRPIYSFDMPNMYVFDIKIVHQEETL